MKKIALKVAALAVVLAFTASCKKCTHCVEKDSAGTTMYDYGEYCGKKKDVDAFEATAKSLVDPGNTVTCD